MTREEHLFMLMLYARQNAKFNTLFEALKAPNVLQTDDLNAYRTLILERQPEQSRESLRQTWEVYQSIAKLLGITTGLEEWPFPQK